MPNCRLQLTTAVSLLLVCCSLPVSSASGQGTSALVPIPSADRTFVAPTPPAVVPTAITPLRVADPRVAELADKYGKLERQVVGLVREFRKAKNDSQRKSVREQIAKLTAGQFDVRHQMRRIEIERIEKHLRDVETKVDRREKLKQEIIDKRVANLLDDDEKLRWVPQPIGGAVPQVSTITMAGEEELPNGTRLRGPKTFAVGPQIATLLAWPAGRTGFVRRRLVKEKMYTPQGVVELPRLVTEVVADPGAKYCYEPGVLMSGPDKKDADIGQLTGIKDLRRLDLSHALITDAGLKHLEQFQTLEALSLVETQITDAGLENVGRLKMLKHLDLRGTHISDEGLRHLHKLDMLESITLDDTRITADGVGQLLAETPIQHLSLNNTQVDSSLADQLTDADSLQTLSVINTAISANGLDALWRVLPNCAFGTMSPAIGTSGERPLVSQPFPYSAPSDFVAPPAAVRPRTTTATAEPLALASGLSVAEAKARLDIANQKLARVLALEKQRVASQDELEEARNATQLAQLNFERISKEYEARRKLLELGVRQAKIEIEKAQAEYDGVVYARKVGNGGTLISQQIKVAASTIEEKKLALERAETLLELHLHGTDEAPASQPTPKQDKTKG